jgi:putative FmdB family regulatory protein
MPTYQYSCTDCGHFFEKVQSFSEDSLTVCPTCQGRLRKVFNAVGVVFKGSGFYRTDSRTDSRTDGRKGEATGEKAKGEKASGEKATGGEAKTGETRSGAGSSGGAAGKTGAGTSAA